MLYKNVPLYIYIEVVQIYDVSKYQFKKVIRKLHTYICENCHIKLLMILNSQHFYFCKTDNFWKK